MRSVNGLESTYVLSEISRNSQGDEMPKLLMMVMAHMLISQERAWLRG